MSPLTCLLIVGAFGSWSLALPAARPQPGKGKSFGVGLLGGAVAGAVMSRALSGNNHNEAQVQQPQHFANVGATPVAGGQQQQQHANIVENGPLLANGCYEQSIKQPDPQDPNKFSLTVQLICPPPAVAIVNPPNLEQAVQPPYVLQMVDQLPATQIPGPPPQDPAQQPGQLQEPMPTQAPQLPFAQNNNNYVQQPPQFVQPLQPIQAVQPVQGPPQVMVISRKTGYYEKPPQRSSASFGALLWLPLLLLAAFVSLL